MKTTIVFVIAIALARGATLHADDKLTPDADMAARIAAANARLKAKSTAATQPVTTNDPVLLRAIIQDQKQQIEALREQVAVLMQKFSATNGDATVADDLPSDEIVLTHREFEDLPKGSDGMPYPFNGANVPRTEAVGFIYHAEVRSVVDEKTAIVTLWTDADLVIQGVATANVADNTTWMLMTWFKIVGTTKLRGTTYFVAKQIVEMDRTHRIPRKLPVSTAAAVKVPSANDPASKPLSSIPSIDGVWQEAPGVMVTIRQDGGKFKAECSYSRADASVIHWEMIGTITADGSANGTLRHTVAPPNWKLSQTRVGKLSADGNTISGAATWEGGSGDFTWVRLVQAH